MADKSILNLLKSLAPAQYLSPEFRDHAKWYNGAMANSIHETNPELGTLRVDGTPYDSAAEFTGSADWAQRARELYGEDPATTLSHATMYQWLNHPLNSKLRNESIAQDKAGIDYATAHPELRREQFIPGGVEYGKTNDFGVLPKYAQGGEVTTPSKLKEFYDAWRKSVTSAAQDYTMPFESSTYNNQDATQSPRMGPDGSTIYSKSRYAQGGEVTPYQPSKMNNTFMAGGLNIINPKNKNKGPLNIQYNANNLLAKSRAQ